MKLSPHSAHVLPVALVAGLLCLFLVSRVTAQSAQGLSAEAVSILGDPEEAKTGLDAGVVAILGRPESGKPAESLANAQAADIASKLRCPVCQGVSIADSPSGMATKMRGQVRDLVAQGYSEEQVISYFERSYGEFVRLEPPFGGLNVMLWVLPGVVLLGGAWFVFRKANAPVVASAMAAPENLPKAAEVDPELAKYLDRIRRDSGTST